MTGFVYMRESNEYTLYDNNSNAHSTHLFYHTDKLVDPKPPF